MPTYLPTHSLTHLLTSLLTYVTGGARGGHARRAYLPTYLLTYLPTYQEEREGLTHDVSYVGVAIGASASHGISVRLGSSLYGRCRRRTGSTTFLIWQVRFDQIIVDGKPEVMVISSEDDWLYGCHHMKPMKIGERRRRESMAAQQPQQPQAVSGEAV